MTADDRTGVGPLLTIAIPTWNRSAYLAANLAQLACELEAVARGTVDIVVSDNCSPDDTPDVVRQASERGLPVHYVRNERNLGWALNFAQAFDLARGKYVLLLGDDDLFVDGALRLLVDRLTETDYGVVIMRPYGFDHDFRLENPGGEGRERQFTDTGDFLIATSRCFTLTSACVLNKSLLSGVDSRQFSTSNLAAFHLMLRAALAGDRNLYLDKYLIASKRQNSFAYDYSEVFVGELWSILDAHVPFGLQPQTIRRIERDKMLSYYPFYLLDLQLSRRSDMAATFENFARRFRERWLFRFWLAPTLTLPRPLAIIWGSATTVVGRVLGGDLRRGLKFAANRVARMLGRRGGALQH